MASERNSNESTSSLLPTEEPTLCSNGCGFFGTAANRGLCSKCYKDLITKESQVAQAKSAKEKSLTPPIGGALFIKATPSSSWPMVQKPESSSDFGWVAADKKAVINRCRECRKRVGLTGFECRCGHIFCGAHRYPEEHGCDFDFKSKGRREIAESNPAVKADKLMERL